jgi:sarcosine oxidase subunit gamma
MAMHELAPLDGWQQTFIATIAPELALRISEVPLLSQVSVRCQPRSAAAERIEAALELRLPRRFGEYLRVAEIDACWLGPDEWLLIAPAGRVAATLDTIAAAAGDEHLLALDVSASRSCIQLSGADARYVLAKGTHEDVGHATFAGQRVVQSLLASVPIILQLHSDDTFRIFVRNSFASHLAQWLVDAAREIVCARRHGLDALHRRSVA